MKKRIWNLCIYPLFWFLFQQCVSQEEPKKDTSKEYSSFFKLPPIKLGKKEIDRFIPTYNANLEKKGDDTLTYYYFKKKSTYFYKVPIEYLLKYTSIKEELEGHSVYEGEYFDLVILKKKPYNKFTYFLLFQNGQETDKLIFQTCALNIGCFADAYFTVRDEKYKNVPIIVVKRFDTIVGGENRIIRSDERKNIKKEYWEIGKDGKFNKIVSKD